MAKENKRLQKETISQLKRGTFDKTWSNDYCIAKYSGTNYYCCIKLFKERKKNKSKNANKTTETMRQGSTPSTFSDVNMMVTQF